MTRKKIAIIGTGIAGLTCAHQVASLHDLTIYEAADYIGGHTHTVEVAKEDETVRVDTGFIVCNDRTYPEFLRLMDGLGVARQATEMSFSVRNDAIGLEYNGGSFSGLFADRGNLVSPRFYRLLAEIVRFNRAVRQEFAMDRDVTIGAFLRQGGYSELFKDNYLLPMISAIWSMGLADSDAFPLRFFARFFDNHGLLDLVNRPQWYTIIGGSSSYIEPLTKAFAARIRLNSPVVAVARTEGGVQVTTPGGSDTFDEVVFACHGDQALGLLASPTPIERQVLGSFHCSDNEVVLHTDTGILPKRQAAWASWNYRMTEGGERKTTLTYNMNILQRLQTRHTYLVTLNQPVAEEHILARFTYRHPLYTTAAVHAQARWAEVSGVDRLHFCGAYWMNGFHEDGVRSGLRVAEMLEDLP